MSTLRQRPRRVPAKSDPTPQGLPKLDSRWQLAKPQFDGEWVRLTELCKPKQWKTIPRASLKQDGYPVYGANGVIGYSDSYNHENETILVGCRGTCGQINVCRPRSYVTGNAMCLDELSEDVDLRYLEQFLRAFDFKAIISGSSQPQITRQGLSKVLVPVRPLDEQRTIADNLGKLSQLENLCERQLSAFDDLVKSRFVEMFGDERNYTKLGDQCSKITKGTTPTTVGFQFQNEGVNFIKIESIGDNGQILLGKMAHIGESCHAALLRSRLEAGDLLFSIAGAIGRTAIVPDAVLPANTNQALAIIRLRSDAPLDKTYLRFALSSDAIRIASAKTKRGIAQINLSLKDVSDFRVPLPPLALQQQFADFVARVDKLGFGIWLACKSLHEPITHFYHQI